MKNPHLVGENALYPNYLLDQVRLPCKAIYSDTFYMSQLTIAVNQDAHFQLPGVFSCGNTPMIHHPFSQQYLGAIFVIPIIPLLRGIHKFIKLCCGLRPYLYHLINQCCQLFTTSNPHIFFVLLSPDFHVINQPFGIPHVWKMETSIWNCVKLFLDRTWNPRIFSFFFFT